MSLPVFQCLALIGLICSSCSDRTASEAIPDAEDPVVTVASTTQIEIIERSLDDGVHVADAYAVRSETHDWAHFVAARLEGVGDDDIGLWFMQDGMDVPGNRSAVNAVAIERSDLTPNSDKLLFQAENRRDVQALLKLVDQRRFKVYPER
ncbi:MAG: hypothetical protein HKN13_01335 [Rhodothermales bacterium]|nr:hypothetical protein [Rhodothermales bacterium]